uniref:BED-type domain-containing protein n=1 Tax=Fundulus heteroclitus TaxID=8078 RepID=A0A3Q2P6D4_FUNHE
MDQVCFSRMTEQKPTDPTTPLPYLQTYMRLVESSDKKYVFRCLLCYPKTKLLSTSKTSNTNLRTHIQRVHPNKMEWLDNERARAKKRCLTPPVNDDDSDLQPSMSQFFRGGTHITSQECFEKLILNFIVQGMHPLHTVDRPEYRQLFSKILPSKYLMSRQTLGALTDVMSKQSHICSTTDAWSSNNRSFLGVSVHWIDEDSLNIRSGALACRRIVGRHIFDVLAVLCLNSSRGGEVAFKYHNQEGFLKKGNLLSSLGYEQKRLNHPAKRQAALKHSYPVCVGELEKLGCQLIVPILTRWNSTYHAMERLNTCILTKEQKFYGVCEKLQVAPLKSTEFTFIQDYVKVNMTSVQIESSATHPMFRLTYIPSDKKAQVVSDLKAEVHLFQTQPSGHRQTEDDNLADDVDEVTGYFPSLRSAIELNEVDSYLQSSETKLVNAFQNLPLMKKLFLKYNTGVPASAACERLFSVGKDIFRPKRNCLSDATFEKLILFANV